MNRRAAFAAIAVTAWGTMEWVASGDLARAQTAPASAPPAAPQPGGLDLARMGAHVYSEEGIPMFLACENLVGTETATAPPSELNRKVGAAFERYSREWQHMHPRAKAADVAKIVELLADRDVKSGGMETGF